MTEPGVRPLALPDPLPTDGPLVSIVIPAYNMAAYARACIESAMNQTYRNIEIVVSDDFSTEPTADVMEEAAAGDPRVTIHRNEANLGAPENFARGVALSHGPLVKFLNADDVLHPECVAHLVAAIEAEPGVVMSIGGVDFINELEGKELFEYGALAEKDALFDGIHLGNSILTSDRSIGAPTRVLFGRAALEEAIEVAKRVAAEVEAGTSPSSAFFPLDQIWYLSTMRQGKAAYVAHPLVSVRAHAGSRSSGALSSPAWYCSLLYCVRWAKRVGYLSDGCTEANAVMCCIAWILRMRLNMDSRARREMDRLHEALLDGLARVDAIEQEIGQGALRAGMEGPFSRLRTNLALLRPRLAGILRMEGEPVRPLALPDPLPTDGPLVSIVIPAYNMAAYARECIESAMNQTYRNIEIVVCDDCSTEPTAEMMEAAAAGDPRVTVHRNEANLGELENYARCVELSHGSHIKFLNADDVLHPECVAHLVAAIESHPQTVMAISDGFFTDERGKKEPTQYIPIAPNNVVLDGPHLGELIFTTNASIGSPSRVMCRRSVFGEAITEARHVARAMKDEISMSHLVFDQFWYLTMLRRGSATFVADPLVSLRSHGKNRSDTVLQAPDWHSSLLYLIQWAKGMGYLRDPRSEAKALMRYVAWVFSIRDRIATSSTATVTQVGRLRDAVIEALERTAEIESTIGTAALEAALGDSLSSFRRSMLGNRSQIAALFPVGVPAQ